MDASDIIDGALAIEQETIDDFYTTAELYKWVNMGQLEFNDLSGVFTKEFTLTSVANQAVYDFPTGLIRPLAVWYDSERIKAADIAFLDSEYPGWRSADASTPERYYEPYSEHVGLYPMPDTSGDVVTILGVAVPATVLSGTETLEIKQTYHDALIEHLLYKMLQKDGRKEEAERHYQVFLAKARMARSEAKQKNRPDRRFNSFRKQ